MSVVSVDDPIVALVEAFAADEGPDVDSRLSDHLRDLATENVDVSPAGPSRATVICVEKGWTLSLQCMTDIDPWAMHYMQSLPASIAAGKAAAEAAAPVAAAIAAGDDVAWNEAVDQLSAAMDTRVCDSDPLQRAAARAAMHAIIKVHEAAGTLTVLTEYPLAHRLVPYAAEAHDVDAVIAFVAAGAQTSRDDDEEEDSVYSCLITGGGLQLDATGAPISDEQLAAEFKRLYNLGVRLVTPRIPEPSLVTLNIAEQGRLHCLRVMIDLIDPHARAGTAVYTVLHAAAGGCQADCITYLRQAGWDVCARFDNGITPLDLSFTADTNTPAALITSITAMTAGMDDVRPLFRASVFAVQCDAPNDDDGACNAPQQFCHHWTIGRIFLHINAAVRATPAAPSLATPTKDLGCFRAPLASMFRSEALDAHSVDGVYIPDQLRAGGSATAAVTLAVRMDVTIDLQPYMDLVQTTLLGSVFVSALAVWQEYVQPCMIPDVSVTLMSWAFMRRQHALKHRRDALRAMMTSAVYSS